jgi:hypothetical protein
MHPELVKLEALLGQLYGRHNGQVAFVDESYREGGRAGEFPFYTVTATLIPIENLKRLRLDFIRVVGGSWWHTTDVYQRGGLDSIFEFLELIVAKGLRTLTSVQVNVRESDLELARRECLIQTAVQLVDFDCRLIVMERREDRSSRNADASLFAKAKASGLIPRNLITFAAHPAAEHLLWAPDLVGWAVRRHLAANDSVWASIVSNQVEIIDVSGILALNAKGPEPAAAKGSGPGYSVDPKGEGKSRSSSTSITRTHDFMQKRFQGFSKIRNPLVPPEVLSTWAIEAFPNLRK